MSKPDYDAIIIGAGISGLVCGCYLAKAGLKTLIVEKNAKPGGYCTSFTRQGFHFDPCVHAVCSLRKGGILYRIFAELGVLSYIKFNRLNPSDIVITPNYKIRIYSGVNETIKEFTRCFPKEEVQIKRFFNYISEEGSFVSYRSATFSDVLDTFSFTDELKDILSTIVSMCLGLPSAETSAMIGCLLFKEFILDGGYYPVGGIQVLPDTLLQRFRDLNGAVICDEEVVEIIIRQGKTYGVQTKNNKIISSKYVVAACDLRQVFFELIKRDDIRKILKAKVDNLVPSGSLFSLYLGVSTKLDIPDLRSNIYLISDDNALDDAGVLINRGLAIHTPSSWDNTLNNGNRSSVLLGINVNYISSKYWTISCKTSYEEKLIKLAERVIPRLSKNIALNIAATPLTLYGWTKNWHGAAFGWASTINQFGNPNISQKTLITNLYITGHWANQSSGVSMVANCARGTATLILTKEKLT